MALVIRPVMGHRQPPDKSDYEVHNGDTRVGQICQMPAPDSTDWFWTLYGKVSDHKQPDCGLANSLDDALMQFKAAWEKAAMRQGDE